MNKTKSSNPVRLIAFFLTAFLLICTFGFTADGWQIDGGDNGQISTDFSPPPSDNGENNNAGEAEEIPDEPSIYIPKFINRITGVEVSEELAEKAHLAFVMESESLFGISAADLICQIPIEGGGTRTVAFIPDGERLWKIGSIAKTRGYISNIVKYFGGLCISGGCEDSIGYNQCDITAVHLDLSLDNKYGYTEFVSKLYSNTDLLESGINDRGINTSQIAAPNLPYAFADFGKEAILPNEYSAKQIRIIQSDMAVTELSFDNEIGKYLLKTNGTPLADAVNGKNCEFENCFVLFADSITYDNSQCSQMIMDTIGQGVGYYFTRGSACEIKWNATEDGSMTFSLLDGTELTVNRGRVYISFVKSSMTHSISFE